MLPLSLSPSLLLHLVTAVDSFAVKQLVKLEEKVPSIKTETGDVLEALSERKHAVCSRISNGKEAVATRLANGKEAISTTIHSGKDALCSRIQAGSEVIANSRPGCFVGSSIDCTLQATENIVDYLLPPEEEGKESASFDAEKEEVKVEAKVSSEEHKDDSSNEDSEGEEDTKNEEDAKEGESRVTRVKNLSRKVKRRVYYRTLRRLDTVQQQCKSALEQLKTSVDLVSWCSLVSVSSLVWLFLCMAVTLVSLSDLLCVLVEQAVNGSCFTRPYSATTTTSGQIKQG